MVGRRLRWRERLAQTFLSSTVAVAAYSNGGGWMKQIDVIEKAELYETAADTDPFAGSGLDGEITWRYLKNGRSPRTGQRIRLDSVQTAASGRRARLRTMTPMLLSLVFVLMAYTLIARRNDFDYAREGTRTILTVRTPYGDTITLDLKTLAYYVILVEREGDRRARDYDAEHPKKYWNLYMNDEGDDSGYISDLARRAVLDYALRDTIYAREAQAAGYTLPEALAEDTVYDAAAFYRGMSAAELSISGYTDEDVREIIEKETLAHEYMIYLAGADGGNVLDTIVTEYDVGGSYYEGLLERYEIQIDTATWQRVRIGFVTINKG